MQKNEKKSALPENKKIIFILIGIMIALLLAAMDSAVVSTSMKKIIESLGGMEQYTWPFTMYVLCSTLAIILCGALADRYGHKRVILIGISIFIGGSLLCGLSQNMLLFIVFRGIQGIGGGIIVSSVFIIIADLFEPRKRGKYTGIVTSMYGVASIIGPLSGGFVTDHFSWHWIFFMNLPIGVLAVILLLLFLPKETKKEKKEEYAKNKEERQKFDLLGMLCILFSMTPLLLVLSLGGKEFSWMSLESYMLFLSSALIGICFLFVEKRAVNPIIPMTFFKDRAIFISFFIAFFSQAIMFGAIMYLPYFMQGIIGFSATMSGLLTVPMMLGLLLASNITGNIISKAARMKLFSVLAFLVMAAGAYLLSTMNLKTSNVQTLLYMILLGFGIGMSMPIANVNAQNAVGREQIGAVTSSVMFFRNMGGTVGSALLGAIMSNKLKNGFSNLNMEHMPKDIQKLITNTQVISNKDTVAEIRKQIPNISIKAFDHIYVQAKMVLVDSIQTVFLVAFIFACIGFVVAFFLRDSSKKIE